MNITVNDEILNKIKENFTNEIYLVGGSVRDYLMGIESHDRDIIVMDEDAKNFSLKLQKLFDATFVPLDIPHIMPSSLARAFAVARASSSVIICI